MSDYVRDFDAIDQAQSADVGGKAAHLVELSRIDGIRVPDGFCVTTDAFDRILADVPAIEEHLDRLSGLQPDDRDAIADASARLRQAVESVDVPDEVATAVTGALARFGADAAYAVRSSATAEDLPTASFAGQQDTYLNVSGSVEVLAHLRRCWASLYTERAVSYRLRNGFEHHGVRMAVVVQRMVAPEASGVMFTVDPVTSDRTVTTVEAIYGLGEALVSGLVNADSYRVRNGEVTDRTVNAKRVALRAAPDGGTREEPVPAARRGRPALTDPQVLRLAESGRRIEAYFGSPQDIEWCLVDGEFHFVQARPITTLFPVPAVSDQDNHVWMSVGHQQMMTDAMKPLGLSIWRHTAMVPMDVAGGRLFVEVTGRVATPAGRTALLDLVGKGDPLVRDALETALDGDFVPLRPDPEPAGASARYSPPEPVATDPAIVDDVIARNRESLAALRRDIAGRSGPDLFDYLRDAFEEHKRILGDPRTMPLIMAAMESTWWLNDRLYEWLGEKNAADTLTLSAPNNVTSEMGLALLDVADVVRPHPELVEFLSRATGDDFLDDMATIDGGAQARDAIRDYLDRYGMRCVGEIDITRPRWSEHPAILLPVLLDNVRNFTAGAGARRFEAGRKQAERKAREVLERLRALPDGETKAAETQGMIDRVRTFIGFREYPKYNIISRYFVYKQALLAEADRLVGAGVLDDREDVFQLTFPEFEDVVRTGRVDRALIRDREARFRTFQALTPPRVITSDGVALSGAYRREDAPDGALVGLPVSAGTIEGRARVVLDMSRADVEPGDILVTAYTDPSWSPLFVAIAGLVTEVGGLMTHGAVVAREYGLPAVVGVADATRLIRDGQRIRVNGTDGYVEILD